MIGQRHIEVISQSPDAVLAAIAEPAPVPDALAPSAARYPNLAEMLSAARPDGVIIATPNALHVEHGLACIDAGIPVLIEKPISGDVASAERLVSMAEARGVPVLVGHHRRHNPIIQAAKAKIAAGALGEVVAVHGVCWLYKPDGYFDTDWRTKPGAGPVFINLIHDIDLLRHFCGEVVSVQAMDSTRTRGHTVEDTAVILMEFASGALGTVTVSDTIAAPWSWELTAGENPAYPHTTENCYFIGGTHGSLSVPDCRHWSYPGQRGWWEPIDSAAVKPDDQDPLTVQLAHFCRVIAGTEMPLVSGREGLRTLRVIEAIKHAAASGERIRLNQRSTPT